MRQLILTSALIALLGGAAHAAAPLMSLAQADDEACKNVVDPAELKEMVDQCIEVSPATRPPCNGENSCDMIVDEIKRGCAMLGSDAPNFCSEYAAD